MPMRIEFTGEYAALMGGYVAFRQNLGFAMPESSQRWLRHMADLLYTMPLISEVIDMERAEAIASRREGESDVTRLGRLVVLRQFCPCPDRIGVGAYVPPAGQVRARSEFVPRIAGEREMARIIEVAEGKALRWPPMVPEILWCTGIRIGEAAAPAVGDFHRKDRSLYVAHAKSDRSRIVPVSESLAVDLGEYVDAHVPGGDSCRWLFPGRDPGSHRSKVAIGNRLRGICREARVLTDEGRPIRTHDIRHSFAIATLEKMVEQGRDVCAALPLLSAFMGHANICDTERYLRFLPSAHRALVEQEAPISHAVFGDGAPWGARPAAGRLSARVRPAAQGPGENTAKSHGDSFAIPPGWLADGRGIAPDDVRAEDPGRENVESFCLWLSDVRGVCAATADVRLCALRSFASYAGVAEPAYLEWASALRAVEFSKSPSGEVEWLPVEAADLIMESASSDAREHAMLGLPCDSGARVSEIANARRCDLRLDAPATTGLSGKGRKVRIVPLCDQVAGMASAYLAATAGAPDSPPFASHGGKAIGRAGITYVPRKHVAAAHGADPLVVPPTTHPHALRHSKAVHLVEADVNIIYIRDFMGHSSVKTTEIYAKISSKSRQKAVEKAAANLIMGSAYGEEDKSAIMEWLRNLL